MFPDSLPYSVETIATYDCHRGEIIGWAETARGEVALRIENPISLIARGHCGVILMSDGPCIVLARSRRSEADLEPLSWRWRF